MQIISAKEAKNTFGETLDIAQREPVLITKNNRPACLIVSIEEIKNTHLAELFYLEVKEDGYEEFVQKKVNASLDKIEKEGSQEKSLDEVHSSIMEKVRLRLQGKR